MIHLQATVARERRMECGCAVVLCAPKLIDGVTGHYAVKNEIVLVPCPREGHLILAKLAAQYVGADDLDVLADEMERLLTG